MKLTSQYHLLHVLEFPPHQHQISLSILLHYVSFLKELIRVSVDLGQATIGERANAFRHHCELAEAIKFKEIDMYVPELIPNSF